ncbi:MAG: Npt1/Npt2 family nucleotide transporter [Thermoanaerobaculia bacterium]|nr:Npt1/Npt2 family nucleotide transporter [Thermoanaerobaculia bacterium]
MTRSGSASAAGGGLRRLACRFLGLDLHAGEGPAACLLFLGFFFLFGFQYATKSIRQSTFVDTLGSVMLPWVYLLVALCSYPLLRLYGRFSERMPFARLVALTCLAVAGSLGIFWVLLAEPSRWVTVVFYVWLAIVFGLTVSQFWFLASHLFDPRQARRLFGFVGAGALLGSVAGGQVARLSTQIAGTRDALLAAASMLVLAAVTVPLAARYGGGGRSVHDDPVASSWSESRGGLEVLKRSRHLQLITVILVCGVIVSQIVDLQFNWAVESATSSLDERTAYFGNLYSIIGLSAFLFQLLLTTRIHRIFGVAAALRVLPVAMVLGAGGLLLAAAFLPGALLQTAKALKIGENGLRYSIDQASRELLFLPVPAALRVKAKAFIDVFVHRAAKGLAALLLLPVTFGWLSPVQIGWVSLALAGGWLTATRWVHREYVRAFRWSLRQRRMDPTLPIKISDSTTLELLIQSLGSPDPRQVLNSLEVLSVHGRGNLVLPLLLHHDDAAVRLRTLEILASAGRRDAVPLIERRLRDEEPEVRARAIRVLAQLSGRDARELMLPRLDEGNPEVRAAAVAFLLSHGDEEDALRAERVLRELARDADPRVRAEAAKALSSIPDPKLADLQVRLLYDPEPRVAREAIQAVGHRLEGASRNPIYLPTLVSLLANRRLKHDARRALVAYGEDGIGPLVHFMSDPDESVWVKRALPKALARIGTRRAAAGLLDCLVQTPDSFLRRELIEALGSTGISASADNLERIREEVRRELRRYLAALRDLASLGGDQRFTLEGPRPRWVDPHRDPSLLERLLIESLDDNLRNCFGLLGFCHDAEHIWPAYQGLLAGRKAVRSHALEFLDNTLDPRIRREVFVMADELPLEEKLTRADRLFGIRRRSKRETLAAFLEMDGRLDDREASLAAAAVYTVYTDGVEALYTRLAELEREAPTPFVRETAAWARVRLQATPTT